MKIKFTENALHALDQAVLAASEFRHNYVGTEHILFGLVRSPGAAGVILDNNSVTEEKLSKVLGELQAPKRNALQKDDANKDSFTRRAIALKTLAAKEAKRFKSDMVGTEHLLMAIIRDAGCMASQLLISLGVNISKMYVEILGAYGVDQAMAKRDYDAIAKGNKRSTTPLLDQFGTDLTMQAAAMHLDPVIGREDEINRLVQILARRSKNNPCLIGDPGVGKTAIVEGLASRIVQGRVPEIIADKRIITLDLPSMVAGTKYRGEFEERIKGVIKEVISDSGIVLFIDEIHTIIGAGSAEGSMDAANILKPALSRGQLQVIGATTREEYRKRIEKDPALERRFQTIDVAEPTIDEAIDILKGLRGKYEEHHGVAISDEAIEGAVKLSQRYINDRFLPDKAIDVIDEACAKLSLNMFNNDDEECALISKQLENIKKEKEEYILAGNIEEAMKLKRKQKRLATKLDDMLDARQEKESEMIVTADEVADIISVSTKVPVSKIKEEESNRISNLESILKNRVVGQDEAVSVISKAIRRGRVGLKDPDRPIGSFLFLGPTGVGKTELSKALAQAVFGSEDNMIRVDMSEYMEKHSVSKMIGSPPGYVGYDEGGQLSERVRRNPYSVILFDEIEKAHLDVFNILLQVLDDGRITDSQGRVVSFKNTIIIMTSNAGAGRIISPKLLGFASASDEKEDYKKMKSNVMEEIKHVFKPEFINRIDDIIVFHSLTKDNIKEIASMMVDKVVKRAYTQLGIKIKVDDSVLDMIATKGFDKDYGARPLRRAIQTQIEDRIATEYLQGNIGYGYTVRMICENDEIKLKKRKPNNLSSNKNENDI